MNISTFTSIFPGSVYKPLSQHRLVVLDALVSLGRLLQGRFAADYPWHERPQWLVEFAPALAKLEQEVLTRLNQSALTEHRKGEVLSLLQTQNNLAHLICRMAERLTYRPPELTAQLQNGTKRLHQHFAETVQNLKSGIARQDRFGLTNFRKQQPQIRMSVQPDVGSAVDELKDMISALQEEVFLNGGELVPLDMALLLLTLEDMDDLTLWIRSMVTHTQQF